MASLPGRARSNVLSVLFGGFQKGTQVKGLGPPVLTSSWVGD